VKLRRLLGAALTVPVLIGALVLLTAGPAVACSCSIPRSDAERAARADAVFVGRLVSRGHRSGRTVWTFEVSRVYKGAVGKREKIDGLPGCGFGRLDPGIEPFVVFASNSVGDMFQLQHSQYVSSYCSGSRPLADGGEPALGLAARAPGWSTESPPPPIVPVGLGVLVGGVAAGLGLASLRARRRASAD
jgi:hypothetical protein